MSLLFSSKEIMKFMNDKMFVEGNRKFYCNEFIGRILKYDTCAEETLYLVWCIFTTRTVKGWECLLHRIFMILSAKGLKYCNIHNILAWNWRNVWKPHQWHFFSNLDPCSGSCCSTFFSMNEILMPCDYCCESSEENL